MHPAKSVIYFTTASGAGYGLLAWLGVLGAMGIIPADRTFGIAAFGSAFFFVISGLLSSTGHLGRPERAWRALSQWRSSWLSREGIAAILTFLPTGLYALAWVLLGQNTGLAGIIGLAGAGLALLTVFTTSMIYASLKTIPAWSNGWTSLGYLVMALTSGAWLGVLLLAVLGEPMPPYSLSVLAGLTVLMALIKLLYWRSLAKAPARSTAESATGLARFGTVRLIESPHSEPNYLLKEMGYRIARKHAGKLRFWGLFYAAMAPLILLGVAAGYAIPLAAIMPLAAASFAIGLVLERWLFFAEAKHVVTLYYGNSAV